MEGSGYTSTPELQKELNAVEVAIQRNQNCLAKYSRVLDSDDDMDITVNETLRESNLARLREEIRRRVERIDITFGATIITGGPVKDIQAGEGKIIARIKFVNGAEKMAIIDKDRATLLDLGSMKVL